LCFFSEQHFQTPQCNSSAEAGVATQIGNKTILSEREHEIEVSDDLEEEFAAVPAKGQVDLPEDGAAESRKARTDKHYRQAVVFLDRAVVGRGGWR
jgi:hypothetical protein